MVNCSNPAVRIVKAIVCVLNSIAALVLGLRAFDVDVLAHPMVQDNLAMLIRPLHIVFVLSGVLGLVFFVLHCCSKNACCK